MTTPTPRTTTSLPLSTPRLRKAPPRPLTAAELTSLRAVADALIPGADAFPCGSGVVNFEAAVTKAAGIMGKYFNRLESALAAHAQLSPEQDTVSWLRSLHSRDDTDDTFWVLSTIVAVVYVNDKHVLGKLNYPVPHRNPPSLTQAADDLDDGILMPVMERGEIFVPTPQT